MEKQELITINGKKLTNNFLSNKASDIADAADVLNLVVASMDHYLTLNALGHSEYFNYYLNSGEFENTVTCLEKLKKQIQDFANDLVPDVDTDRKIYQQQTKHKAGDLQ